MALNLCRYAAAAVIAADSGSALTNLVKRSENGDGGSDDDDDDDDDEFTEEGWQEAITGIKVGGVQVESRAVQVEFSLSVALDESAWFQPSSL
jgi:hypothetical protein